MALLSASIFCLSAFLLLFLSTRLYLFFNTYALLAGPYEVWFLFCVIYTINIFITITGRNGQCAHEFIMDLRPFKQHGTFRFNSQFNYTLRHLHIQQTNTHEL
jgi:hypothetical protein